MNVMMHRWLDESGNTAMWMHYSLTKLVWELRTPGKPGRPSAKCIASFKSYAQAMDYTNSLATLHELRLDL